MHSDHPAREGGQMDSKVVKKLSTANGAPKKSTTEKVPSAPKTSKAPRAKKHGYNAETVRVLRAAEAGKNLTTSVDADDLFKKLGIKIGKAKV
jgi:hypothetical protein